MIWTMPRPVLQWVAGLLALGATAAFAMGIINAPDHGGRLPGERAARGAPGGVMAINAMDATPLTAERIEAAPVPVKVANRTDTNTTDGGDTAVTALPPKVEAAKPLTPAIAAPPPEETVTPTAPPPEEPPH